MLRLSESLRLPADTKTVKNTSGTEEGRDLQVEILMFFLHFFSLLLLQSVVLDGTQNEIPTPPATHLFTP